MLTLAISCLTTSNLPHFMDLTFQVPMQYCSLQPQTYFHHHSHPQLGIDFALAQPLHSLWSYFSTLLQQLLVTYRPGEFIFQCYIFLPFHTVHRVLKARIQPQEPSNPLFVYIYFPLLDILYKWNHITCNVYYQTFSVSMILLRFIHIVRYISSSIFSIAEKYFIGCITHIGIFIHSLMDIWVVWTF